MCERRVRGRLRWLALVAVLSNCGGRSTSLGEPNPEATTSPNGGSSAHDPDNDSSSGGTIGSALSANGGRPNGGRANGTSGNGGRANGTSGNGGRANGTSGNGGRANGASANGGSGSAGWAAAGDATAGAGEHCAGETCLLSADPAPRWVTRLTGYGRGPAWIRFADASIVEVAAGDLGLFDVATLDRATGEVQGQPPRDKTFMASDLSGQHVARSIDQDCAILVDGRETFRFRFDALNAARVRFSGDGSVVAHHTCSEAGLIQMTVYATESGQPIAAAESDLPCFSNASSILVDSEHRRTLFTHPARRELFAFDWDSQQIENRVIHAFSPVSLDPRNHEGSILNLSLSPDGRRLVSVGAADGLAWLAPDSLELVLRVADVPFFNAYDECYCTYHSESPVAWSPQGDIYATAHSSGGIALRDSADQSILAVLAAPTDPKVINRSNSTDFGPVLLEFAPDMRQLVAMYPSYAVGYSLAAR